METFELFGKHNISERKTCNKNSIAYCNVHGFQKILKRALERKTLPISNKFFTNRGGMAVRRYLEKIVGDWKYQLNVNQNRLW